MKEFLPFGELLSLEESKKKYMKEIHILKENFKNFTLHGKTGLEATKFLVEQQEGYKKANEMMFTRLAKDADIKLNPNFIESISDITNNTNAEAIINKLLDSDKTVRNNLLTFYNLIPELKDPNFNKLLKKDTKILSEGERAQINSKIGGLKDVIIDMRQDKEKKQAALKKAYSMLESTKNEMKDKTFWKKMFIASFTGLIALLVFNFLEEFKVIPSSKMQNAKNKKRALSNNDKENIDDLKALVLAWYGKQVSGCFMIKHDGVTRLDGCSDWYGTSVENQLNCSCGTSTNDTMIKSNCDTPEECLKPYCIGNDKCTNSSPKCSDEQLYQCAGDSIADPNYVRYMYLDNNIFSLYSDILNIQDAANKNNTDNNGGKNILLYVIIFLVVIFVIAIIIFFMKRMKKIKGRK